MKRLSRIEPAGVLGSVAEEFGKPRALEEYLWLARGSMKEFTFTKRHHPADDVIDEVAQFRFASEQMSSRLPLKTNIAHTVCLKTARSGQRHGARQPFCARIGENLSTAVELCNRNRKCGTVAVTRRRHTLLNWARRGATLSSANEPRRFSARMESRI